MIHHLAPNGSLALLLANGSMSSNTNNKGEIRDTLLPKLLSGEVQVKKAEYLLTKAT